MNLVTPNRRNAGGDYSPFRGGKNHPRFLVSGGGVNEAVMLKCFPIGIPPKGERR